MRVLTMTEFYPPVSGGSGEHAQALGRELRRQGHEVAVVALATPGEPADFDEGGIRVTRIDGWNTALDRIRRGIHLTAADPGLKARLDATIDDFQPDVVHVHGRMLHSALTKRRSDEHAVVATMHDFALSCPKGSFLYMDASLCSGPGPVKCYRCAVSHAGVAKGFGVTTGLKISSRLHRHADRYVAVSSAVRNAVVDSGANRDVPVEVVPDFFDPSVATGRVDAPRPDCVPATGDYVLVVAAPDELDGVQLLNDVWRDRRPAAPLVLFGAQGMSGFDERDLASGVSMAPSTSPSDLMAAVANCTVVVSHSHRPDSWPRVVLAAMALGKPVIGAGIGAIPDLVLNGKTGTVVPPRDKDAFGEAIDQLLAAPSLAGQYGAAGRAHARGFTVEAVARRLDGIYARAIARRRNDGREAAAPRTPQAGDDGADRTTDPLTLR